MKRQNSLLDGDDLRHGLNNDLDFIDADQIENIRHVGDAAKLMTDAVMIVIAAFISPFRSERQMVLGEFIAIFIDTLLSVPEERDIKGLFAKARSGQLKNFVGIVSPYGVLENHTEPTLISIHEPAEQIVKQLLGKLS